MKEQSKPCRVTLAVVAMLACGCALAAKPAARAFDKADLPPGFVVGSGEPALALRVQIEGGQLTSAPADLATANVTASGGYEDGQAMLTIRHELDVAVKFDLYISQDGKRFVYTSSCGVTPGISSFEMWPEPIRAFALGNPRAMATGKLTCD